MTILHETADCDRVRNVARLARLARMSPNKSKPVIIEIVEHPPEPILVERKLVEPVWVPVEKENNRLKYSRLDDHHKGEPLLVPVPSLDYIKRTVAKAFGVSVLDMESARRTKDVVRPRQIAVYFCATLTRRSLPAIARAFGGRDHTTALHSRNKIAARRAADPVLDMKLEGLKAIILDTFLGVPPGPSLPQQTSGTDAAVPAQVPPPPTDLPHGESRSEHSGSSA